MLCKMDKYVKYKILKKNYCESYFWKHCYIFRITHIVKISLPYLLHLFDFYYNYLYKFTRYLTFYE